MVQTERPFMRQNRRHPNKIGPDGGRVGGNDGGGFHRLDGCGDREALFNWAGQVRRDQQQEQQGSLKLTVRRLPTRQQTDQRTPQ